MVAIEMESSSQNGIRIKINFDKKLQKYAGYNKIWFYVDLNSVRTIKDLQLELRNRFGFKCDCSWLHLFLDDFLLMPEETIAVLKNGDLIVITRQNPDVNISKDSSSKIIKALEVDANEISGDIFQNQQRSKINSALHSLSSQLLLTDDLIKSKSSKKHKSKKLKKSELLKETEETEKFECNADDEKTLKNNVNSFSNGAPVCEDVEISMQKKKRNRHRKRKYKTDLQNEVKDNNSLHDGKMTFPMVPLKLFDTDLSAKKRQHIRFGDNEMENGETLESNEKTLNADNSWKDLKEIRNSVNGFDQNHLKNSSFESKRYQRKRKIDDSSLNMECETSETQPIVQTEYSVPVLDAEPVPVDSQSTAKNYDLCDNLEGAPRIGDIIAFKELILSEDYSPEVSEYRVGKVQKYDSKTQDLEIELIQELTITKPNGKFELDAEEEATEIKVNEMKINLKALFSPKLVN